MPALNIKYIFYGFVALIVGLIILHFYNLEKEHISNGFEKEVTKVITTEKKKDEVATDKLETKYETVTKVEIQYVDRIVTKEVIKYRDRVVNRCQLDPEWVRVYNLSTDEAGAESSPSIINGKTTVIGKITSRQIN